MGFFSFFKKKSSNKKKEEESPLESKEKATREGKSNQSTKQLAKKKPAKSSFWAKLKHIFASGTKLETELIDEIEELLITTDMGVKTADKLIKKLEKLEKKLDLEQAITILKKEIIKMLTATQVRTDHLQTFEKAESTEFVPHIILMVGVNGAGKTTSIGKLAHHFVQKGKKVMIGAADTFRAAAIEQLQVWGNKIGVPVVSHGMQKSPSAVAYDSVKQAIETKSEVLLIDTAGRLHNKVGLMNELAKIKRVIRKKCPAAPQEILLVLDGSTGQNAWMQATIFHEFLNVTGLIVSKLDGTAKGGVLIGISEELRIPIKYIGLGEKLPDLVTFDAKQFAESLFEPSA